MSHIEMKLAHWTPGALVLMPYNEDFPMFKLLRLSHMYDADERMIYMDLNRAHGVVFTRVDGNPKGTRLGYQMYEKEFEQLPLFGCHDVIVSLSEEGMELCLAADHTLPWPIKRNSPNDEMYKEYCLDGLEKRLRSGISAGLRAEEVLADVPRRVKEFLPYEAWQRCIMKALRQVASS